MKWVSRIRTPLGLTWCLVTVTDGDSPSPHQSRPPSCLCLAYTPTIHPHSASSLAVQPSGVYIFLLLRRTWRAADPIIRPAGPVWPYSAGRLPPTAFTGADRPEKASRRDRYIALFLSAVPETSRSETDERNNISLRSTYVRNGNNFLQFESVLHTSHCNHKSDYRTIRSARSRIKNR